MPGHFFDLFAEAQLDGLHRHRRRLGAALPRFEGAAALAEPWRRARESARLEPGRAQKVREIQDFPTKMLEKCWKYEEKDGGEMFTSTPS